MNPCIFTHLIKTYVLSSNQNDLIHMISERMNLAIEGLVHDECHCALTIGCLVKMAFYNS